MRLQRALGAMTEKTDLVVAGTVLTVDETDWTCSVQPEVAEMSAMNKVSLRPRAFADCGGVLVVPQKNTECMVLLDNGLPFLLWCQRWEKIIVSKSGAMPPTRVAHREPIEAQFAALKSVFDSHTHGEHDGPSTSGPSSSFPEPGKLGSEDIYFE